MKYIDTRVQNPLFTAFSTLDVIEDFETGFLLILQGGKHEL